MNNIKKVKEGVKNVHNKHAAQLVISGSDKKQRELNFIQMKVRYYFK